MYILRILFFAVITLNCYTTLAQNNEEQITDSIETSVDTNHPKNYQIPSSNRLATSLDNKVDAEIRHYMMKKGIVGLSIGILYNGKSVFYGYGETAEGSKEIPNEHTIYEIGSLSKTFTATLLAISADSGIVKLDDPVSKYLPDSIPPLQYEGIPVTLKLLSNHTSGIPYMPSNMHPANKRNPYKDYTVSDLFSFYTHFSLERKPGEHYEYSNLAFATIGVILEKAYQKSYETLVREKICEPMGMFDTWQFIRENDSLRFAQGYGRLGKPVSHWDLDGFAGAGALRSTAEDLLKYAKLNMGIGPPDLVDASNLVQKLTFSKGHYVGMGWLIHKPGSHQIIMMGGLTGGFNCYLFVNREKQIAVVILSNKWGSHVETPAYGLIEWLGKSPLQEDN
jgi:CubicO group peptidase (beta-lactamase class C family)